MTEPKSNAGPHFDLIAGNICLDFVNTLDDRYSQPKELLANYRDLVRFGEDAGLLKPKRAAGLINRGEAEPHRAEEAMRRARTLREAIHDVFRAIMHERPAPAEALARLNTEVRRAAGHLILAPKNGRFAWRFDDADDLESVVWPIARAAGELLASDQLPFVRACSADNCQWFFLDTSKSHQRRWCDMKRCGNRAKVRNFYARQRIHHESSEARKS